MRVLQYSRQSNQAAAMCMLCQRTQAIPPRSPTKKVPSNAKAGYLARMIARRVLRMRDDLGLEVSLADLAIHHLEMNYSADRMKQTQDGLVTILKGEEERYDEMLRKGNQVVKTAIKDISKSAAACLKPHRPL